MIYDHRYIEGEVNSKRSGDMANTTCLWTRQAGIFFILYFINIFIIIKNNFIYFHTLKHCSTDTEQTGPNLRR